MFAKANCWTALRSPHIEHRSIPSDARSLRTGSCHNGAIRVRLHQGLAAMAVPAAHVALCDLSLQVFERSVVDQLPDVGGLRAPVTVVELENDRIGDAAINARMRAEVSEDERLMPKANARVAISRPLEIGRPIPLVVLSAVRAAARKALRPPGSPRPVLDRECVDRLLALTTRADPRGSGHLSHLRGRLRRSSRQSFFAHLF